MFKLTRFSWKTARLLLVCWNISLLTFESPAKRGPCRFVFQFSWTSRHNQREAMRSISVANVEIECSAAYSSLWDFCTGTAKALASPMNLGDVSQPRWPREQEGSGEASFFCYLSRVNKGSGCNGQVWTAALCHSYVLSLVCPNRSDLARRTANYRREP